MKRFSTVRDTQRGSQSYIKKRRGMREIEVTRRRRRGVKRGDSPSYKEKRRGRRDIAI